MKKRLLAVSLALMWLVQVNAQLISDDSPVTVKHDIGSTENFFNLGVSWTHVGGKNSFGDYSHDVNMNGFAINMDVFANISKGRETPLFLLVGYDIGLAFGENKADTRRTNMGMTVDMHGGIAYKLRMGRNFYFTPYGGLNFKINCLASSVIGHDEGKTINFFKTKADDDTNEIPYSDKKANRIQPGLILGGMFQFNRITLSYRYLPDFIPFYKNGDSKISLNTHLLTLGYALHM